MTGLKNGSMWKGLFSRCTLVALALSGILVSSEADGYTISQGNSSVQINAEGTGSGPVGLTGWLVDGVNQARQQWFYYRVGDTGGQSSIDSLGLSSALPSSAGNALTLTYDNGSYRATVAYTVTGGSAGSGDAWLNESISFINNSSTSINLRFFDYSYFTLNNTLGGQSVQFYRAGLGPAAATNSFFQTLGSLWLTNSTTAATLKPRFEAALFDNTLSRLTSGTATLNNNASASGDVTAALEWDVTLNGSGGGVTISKVTSLHVPEPSVFSFILLGSLGWGVLARRRALRSSQCA